MIRIAPPFLKRPGNLVPYPGINQTEDTCLFASITSGVNWLTSNNITEQQTFDNWKKQGHTQPDFTNVAACILPDFPMLTSIEYRDDTAPLPNAGTILNQIESGGVLILSLEVGTVQNTNVTRINRWHMLSVFRGESGKIQVWDTNGYDGLLEKSEVIELLTGTTLALPYTIDKVLLPHAVHHCLMIRKKEQ